MGYQNKCVFRNRELGTDSQVIMLCNIDTYITQYVLDISIAYIDIDIFAQLKLSGAWCQGSTVEFTFAVKILLFLLPDTCQLFLA